MAAVEKTLTAARWRSECAGQPVHEAGRRPMAPVDGAPPDLIGALERIGYPAHLFSFENDAKDPELSRLLKALAVAGFCAMNIMLLSVSVWFGADGQNTAGVSSRFGLAGVSCHSLFRKDLLSLGMVGVAPRPHEHGRADLNRCDASLRP